MDKCTHFIDIQEYNRIHSCFKTLLNPIKNYQNDKGEDRIRTDCFTSASYKKDDTRRSHEQVTAQFRQILGRDVKILSNDLERHFLDDIRQRLD